MSSSRGFQTPPATASPVPPPLPGGRCARPGKARLWLGGLGVVAGIFALVLLYLHRPAGQFFYPRCSLYTATGLLCPACGGLRSSHELLHGNLLGALRSNALLVLGLPVGFVWWAWCRARGRSFPAATSAGIWWMFAGVAVFTVLRNLPGWPFAWLAPGAP